MTVFVQGTANPAAYGVPGLSVVVQPPPSAPLPGAPSDILGIVGTAKWGPMNSPVAVSDEAGAATVFSPMSARTFDLITAVHIAGMQGARNFRLVRVGDGTEAAATVMVQTSGGTATAKYPGSAGAGIVGTIAAGTKDSTKKITLAMPGKPPEVFDNIAATAASNASWVAIAAAINSGTDQRGPSKLITFAAGASTSAPANGTFQLTGGTDGAGVTASNLVGVDTVPRTGMYALRNTGVAAFMLADVADPTTFAGQIAFAKSEVALGYATSPSNDTLTNIATVMTGIDDPWLKVMFGDWVYMLDGVNNIVRVTSPQAWAAGNKMAQGPHNTSLNKPLNGVVGTQRSYASQQWSSSELQTIGTARADVVVMSSPGGDYPSLAFGRNSSSDVARRQETYTTMTNYLARSLDQKAGIGGFIGRLITPDETRELKSAIGAFLQNERDEGRIGNSLDPTAPAYAVSVDNSQANVGVQKAVVIVSYLSVTEYIAVDLSGGSTVQIVSTIPNAA